MGAEKAEQFTVLVGCWQGSGASEQKAAQLAETVPTPTEPTPAEPATPQNKKVGVGLTLGIKNDRLAVTGKVRHSENARSLAQIDLGDRVLKIDGRDVWTMAPVAAQKFLDEGPLNSTVTLFLWRYGLGKYGGNYDRRWETTLKRIFLP